MHEAFSCTSLTGSSDGGKETAASAAASPPASPVQSALPQEQERHTGEEGETVLYEAEGTLFQFDDQDTKTWRERGQGELRVNKAPSGQSSAVCIVGTVHHNQDAVIS